ncbi:putative mitochondrial ATP-dependent helicase irc3 [Neolecta irregularis DAH-3]|uniref:Putative mitochondrial ATP-dependent helicase irc3 n=1 Tax=Neolecta irregularis (strain DAH-3) TaxID=1198029 RepID=A0A1U7LNT6_NEOID|nr:putative mitochondrial ATP-dependent helicase irc3 [Neolecta irregularis DAH-3]|eukprot:OLL24253.1 putative mitochondrial ATP-dependent helicase irc3 [Neolecta irregularis DAH-3]
MFSPSKRCLRTLRVAVYNPIFAHPNPIRITWLPQNYAGIVRKYTSAVKLRPYQEECIEACLSHMEEGKKRLAISLATGSGKTVIFTSLIQRVPSPSKDATRTLILVHRSELAQQAARHCKSMYPDSTVEIEMGNHLASGFADITIASVQSLISKNRMEKFDPKRIKLILIDEAHHAAAPSYLKILDYFGAGSSDTNTYVVGFSATLSRLDGLKLGRAMDYVVYHKSYLDMIDVKFTSVKSGVNLSGVKKAYHGDFQLDELSKVVNTSAANEITVRAWLDRASHRKSTLVFCVDIQHVQDLTNTFRQYGIDARYITNNTIPRERQDLVQAFKKHEYPVLVNCGIFTEGTDIPNIDSIILARPTHSRNLLIQMIGRGMRLHNSKADCHVIDMVDGITKGIVCVPTLFGLDPFDLVENATLKDLEKMVQERAQENEQQGSTPTHLNNLRSTLIELQEQVRIIYTDWSSVRELIDDAKNMNIQQMSRFAWTVIDETKYILEIIKHGFIRVELDNKTGTYYGTYTADLPSFLKVPWMNPHIKRTPKQLFKDVETLEQAIHAADSFARKECPRILLERRAAWRSKGPPTQGQIEFLRKVLKDETFNGRNFTKGQAMDLITKMKHGFHSVMAKSRRELKRKSRQQERELKQAEKEQLKIEKMQKRLRDEQQRQEQRDNVQVGPLTI